MRHPGSLVSPVVRHPILGIAAVTLFATSLACAGLVPEAPKLPEPAPQPSAKRDMMYFYVPGPNEVKDAKFAEWTKGDRLYIGVHDVNLRTDADTTSKILRTLPLGMEVEVLEVGEVAVLTQRRNRWYRVRTPRNEGWVFGAVLSPVRVMLPGTAGADAPAVVTFNPEFGPRVRVRDPRAGGAEGREWSLDVEPTDDFVGGVLTATLEPVGNDKQVVVEQCDSESARCGTTRVRIVDGELVEVE